MKSEAQNSVKHIMTVKLKTYFQTIIQCVIKITSLSNSEILTEDRTANKKQTPKAKPNI